MKKFGGNGEVTFEDNTAIKRLKLNALKNKEKRERFINEIKILQNIKESDVDNIVEIIDFNFEGKNLWFSMPKLHGNLNEILEQTKGNVKKSLGLILPLVKSLKKLSELDDPIYHRDLKPDNILFKKDGDNLELYLADFGCAYFKSDEEDRITQEFRAVGAMAFRAPEYQFGRVNEVNEKGDIFSIGKILWYVVNGNLKEVFPYTLWFPEEYDLNFRFPNKELIPRLNLIIAKCVDHNPNERINYDTLIVQIENIINTNVMGDESDDLKLKLLKKNQELKLEKEQRKIETNNLLKLFSSDLKNSIKQLRENYAEIDFIEEMDNSISNFGTTFGNLNVVIDKSLNCALWNFNLSMLKIESRIYPLSDLGTKYRSYNLNPTIPFIIFSCTVIESNEILIFHILESKEKGLIIIYNNKVIPYRKNFFGEFWQIILHKLL